MVTTFEEEVIPLTIENVSKIGYMGFDEMEMSRDLWPTGSYLQYMFMATMAPIVSARINNTLK